MCNLFTTLSLPPIFANTPKKVALLPEIDRVKISLSLTHPHNRMCIKIYIFNLCWSLNLKQAVFYTTYSFKIHVSERKYKNNLKNHESQNIYIYIYIIYIYIMYNV